MTHTPTPWTMQDETETGVRNGRRLIGANGVEIIFAGEEPPLITQHDAAHIVHCVNSHDALVEALRYVRQFYQDNFDVMPVAFQTVDSEIDKALALAEKGA